MSTNSNQQAYLIAVTAGKWQLNALKQAKHFGLKIIAIDSNPQAEGFALADICICQPLTALTDIINEIEQALEQQTANTNQSPMIASVICHCSDVGMLLAGQLREHYQISFGPNAQVSIKLTNKAEQRRAWQTVGIDKPKWLTVSDFDELKSATEVIGFPAILKPVDSAGSRGVIKMLSLNDCSHERFNQSLAFSNSRQLILEQFITGQEYAVEVYINNKRLQLLCITQKIQIPNSDVLVSSELITVELAPQMLAGVQQLLEQAYLALDYANGPGHAEIIIDQQQIAIVEVAGRGGGFKLFDELVPIVSGIDITSVQIAHALGQTIELPEYRYKPAVLGFFPSQQGKVTAIKGFDQANMLEGVKANAFIDVNTSMSQASSDGDRMGYFIATAKTRAACKALASKVRALIKFELE